MGRKTFSISGAGKIGQPHAKKVKLDQYHTSDTKINSDELNTSM